MGHVGWLATWALNYLSFLALGLAMEVAITLLGLKWMPFFLITWIIINITSSFLPICKRILHGLATLADCDLVFSAVCSPLLMKSGLESDQSSNSMENFYEWLKCSWLLLCSFPGLRLINNHSGTPFYHNTQAMKTIVYGSSTSNESPILTRILAFRPAWVTQKHRIELWCTDCNSVCQHMHTVPGGCIRAVEG